LRVSDVPADPCGVREAQRPPMLLAHRAREIPLFERPLHLAARAVRPRLWPRIGPVLAARLEVFPGGDPPLLEILHEVPERRPHDLVGEPRIPGDVDAERQMLVEAEVARQPALHEGERPLDHGARALDLVGRVRRFELDPVDTGLRLVGLEPRDAIVEIAVRRIARIALCHHDEIGIELISHVHCGAIARDRLLDRHDLDAGALRAALALDRLVVDAYPRDPGAYALADHAAHRHDPAVAGVAVHDDREADAVRDPAGDLYALGHGRGAHVGEPGIRPDDTARADEARFATRQLHDSRVRSARRMQDREHLSLAMYELLQPCR